jgi:hypothetical protein
MKYADSSPTNDDDGEVNFDPDDDDRPAVIN